MKNLLWIYSILLLATLSCDKQSPGQPLIGNWKMVVDTLEQVPPSPFGIRDRGITYEFINDSIVDTKKRYYIINRLATRDEEYKYLGTTTKYKVEGDSLKFFNPTDSGWEKGKYLKKVTGDSLILVNAEGAELIFLRHVYKEENSANIDVIALSSFGCFGTCPIINIIIDSTGGVTFYGERYVSKIGFFEGQIAKERFKRIRSEFNQADIEKLKQSYSVDWTDDETISTTFISKGEIVNSIKDYGEAGPSELVWGYTSLRYLFQDLELKELDSTKVPFYLDLHFFRIEKGEEICVLTKSESFLLWNYLRRGALVQSRATSKYRLGFVRNHTWFPHFDKMKRTSKKNTEEKVKAITTDGQFYTFDIAGQKTITIDIGFNFFDRNQKFLSFREKKEFD